MRSFWKTILITTLCFMAKLPLMAQSVPEPVENVVQEWTFDNGLENWVPQNSSVSVGWAADASPGFVGTAPTFSSPPNSLNYNNGQNYDTSTTGNSGSATSPLLDIGGLTDPKITFSCLYETEPSPLWDIRTVEISNSGFSAPSLFQAQLLNSGSSPSIGDCLGVGIWHVHTLDLDPTWGAIEIRFAFDSIDELYNDYPGWFIDDVKLTATGNIAGFVGYSPESKPEGENGNHSINDTLCGGAIPGKPLGIFFLALSLTVLLFMLYRVRRS